ncbi:MAG: helix-turn-helix domain-containing protein [Clostridiaceae bacterium]
MTIDVFRQAKEGDQTAMCLIIKSFEGWVVKQSHYYNLRGYDVEDFKQVCYQAIVYAVYHLNDEELITAPSFIIRCMQNALKFECRKVLSKPASESLNKETESGMEFVELIIDESADTETQVIHNLEKTALKASYAKLTSEEKDLISYYIMNPYGGLKEYADKYGKNYRKVRYLKDLALAKLKADF